MPVCQRKVFCSMTFTHTRALCVVVCCDCPPAGPGPCALRHLH
jgi:hypothetical protein